MAEYIVVCIISYLAGAMTKLGYYQWKGRKVLLPFVSATSRNYTIAAVVFGLLATYTFVTVSVDQARNDECNRQFREALAYNTMVNSQDRDLTNRLDDIASRKEADLDRVIGAVAADPFNSPTALREYNDRIDDYNLERAKIGEERRQIADTRLPYPEPTCGK